MFDDLTVSSYERIAREAWFGFERTVPRRDAFDRVWSRVGAMMLARWTHIRGQTCRRIIDAVEQVSAGLASAKDDELVLRARACGQKAFFSGPRKLELAAELFAVIREVTSRNLGMRHYDVQLMGGYAMLQGYVAEMQTGEGKTLTATLSAGAMALSGRPVHVVTTNDYLAQRDAEAMAPVYRALGLSVASINQRMDPDARRKAYAANVTYCANNELAFDYLKDRLAGVAGVGRLTRRVRTMYGNDAPPGVLRGLAFALIDEADSVLIDEARTPLILSSSGPTLFDAESLESARLIAESLEAGDYNVDFAERRVELRPGGMLRLERVECSGMLANPAIREELVCKALSVKFLFRRNEQYLVRDEKIEIIDEYTGRVMPDRFWSDGIQQLIEIKEGIPLSKGRKTLLRTTYQRFFRRYDLIAGMTGTAREVAGELWHTYGLPVASIPSHRPVRRTVCQPLVLRSMKKKWNVIARDVKRLHMKGSPVLIGTRSVHASRMASQMLERHGIPHVVLSAEQNSSEAEIIEKAGQKGMVTVATNMAGRGADIKLGMDVAALGGLHVIMSEMHDSRRIDRQLEGRAGRQGDPGWFRAYLSLEDPILRESYATLLTWVIQRSFFSRSGSWRYYVLRRAQAQAEALHGKVRRNLVRQDEILDNAIAFSGRPD